jgi:uncharacterized membrane protein YedE/YeeE
MLPFYLSFFGVHLFGFKIDVSIICCLAAVIVTLSVRQFLFKNERIQNHLQSSHDAKQSLDPSAIETASSAAQSMPRVGGGSGHGH